MRLVAIPAGLLPTHTHTLSACHSVGRCALRMNDYEEKPMENINKAGPSEQRREELRLLMQKMKESGKLGGTGMMSDMNEGGALEGSHAYGLMLPTKTGPATGRTIDSPYDPEFGLLDPEPDGCSRIAPKA